MSTTGTPKTLDNYTSRIVTEEVSLEVWFEALECFRLKLVQEIFPKITLKKLSEQCWVLQDDQLFALDSGKNKPKIIGDNDIYSKQGFYRIDRDFSSDRVYPLFKKFWGLTRDGIWIRGKVIFNNDDPRISRILQDVAYVSFGSVTCKELLIIEGLYPAVVVSSLSNFVKKRIIEKYRNYQKLNHDYWSLKLFADIAELRMQQKSQ